ncbi:PA3715 family protein [Acinetobacter indicus]|uniref:hypothetical protein n=1 Tax=Acinetobacter indicus TaxID=756892 RepID=UPI000CECCF30|nr:hypothetical protein [Acinetobacter indicus]
MRLLMNRIVLLTSVWPLTLLGMMHTAVAKPQIGFDSLCKQPEQIEKILKQYQITNTMNKDFLACASLPNMPEHTLIAYAEAQTENDQIVDDYQLTFLTLNSQTHQMNSIYRVKEPLVSDAIELRSIQLDLAAYQVAKDVRAIGLRRNYIGHSRANPFSAQVLDLYDLKNKKNILNSLIVARSQAETDTRCNQDGLDSKAILIMLRHKTQQYFDIQLHDRIQAYEMSGDLEECKETKRVSTQQRFTLKFDGQQYRIPELHQDQYLYD